jgi:EmrB/QacA subfamily drug resistance transporter
MSSALPSRDSPDDSDRIDPAVWKIAAVAAGGAFMSQIDATVVNVSLSSLAASLHSSLTTIQWVTSGYLLALALTLPLNGWIVDRIGAKAVYMWCFTAFTLSSALCGLAWSAGSLIGFRVLQGMCGGLLAPMAQMMVARAAGRHMAQVIGVSALPVLLAPLLGPVLAGAILQFASWRWLFLVNLPVGVLAITLAYLFLPNDKGEKQPRRLDVIGLVLLSPGLVLFLYGTDHLAERLGIPCILAALIMFAVFWKWAARKGDGALIDLRLLKEKVFSASITTMFMANGMNFAGQMLIPIYLIKACGRSPSATGLLMAPMGVGMMCIYPWIGTLTKRFGARRVAVTGSLVALSGTAMFLYLANHSLQLWLLILALFLRGIGSGGIGIPAISSAYAGLPRKDIPMATAAMNIVQRLGGPTLTTVCATFLGWRLASATGPATLPGAFTAAFGLLCALQAVLFLVTFRLPWSVPTPEKLAPAEPAGD